MCLDIVRSFCLHIAKGIANVSRGILLALLPLHFSDTHRLDPTKPAALFADTLTAMAVALLTLGEIFEASHAFVTGLMMKIPPTFKKMAK